MTQHLTSLRKQQSLLLATELVKYRTEFNSQLRLRICSWLRALEIMCSWWTRQLYLRTCPLMEQRAEAAFHPPGELVGNRDAFVKPSN